MVLTNSDFFSIINQKRGGFNEIILYFYFSFMPWITLSRVKWNIQEMVRFFFKTWYLEVSTLPKKESVLFPEFLLIARQILKSSIIKASKYKVQDTTEVIKKEDRL